MSSEKREIVGLSRDKDIFTMVRKAVELSGGMDFIKPGQTILIKPNANTADEYPGSTNPYVLRAVIKLVFEHEPREVIVGEKSMNGLDTIKVLKKTGMYDVAVEEKAHVISFDEMKWIKVKPKGCVTWEGGFFITSLINKVDHIITIPVAKTHWTATFTMALKNQIGFLSEHDRELLPHGIKNNDYLFGWMIAEANLIGKPSLIVMDATRCFVAGGPNIGEIREASLIIASKDPVANDVTGLAVLKYLGTVKKISDVSVWEQPQIKIAALLNLGVKNSSEIDFIGYGVPELLEIRNQLDSAATPNGLPYSKFHGI